MAANSKWSDHAPVTISITEQGGKNRSYNLDDFVGFDMSEQKLLDQLQEQPAKFAYIASLHAAAMVARERVEERASFVKAELFLKIRGQAGDLKLTNPEVEAMVKTHPKYVACNDDWILKREQEEQLKAIRDALVQRKDIMILIANNYRRERDTNPGGRLDGRNRT